MEELEVYIVSFEEDKITYTLGINSSDIYIGWINSATEYFDSNNNQVDWDDIRTLKLQGRVKHCLVQINGEILMSLNVLD